MGKRELISTTLAAVTVAAGLTVTTASPAAARVGPPCSGSRLERVTLSDGGVTLGWVELWYKNGENCVQTVKAARWEGTPDSVYARLSVGTTNNPNTAEQATYDYDPKDATKFSYYAGGVWLYAANKCVIFAGSIGIDRRPPWGSYEYYDYYVSPWSHCG